MVTPSSDNSLTNILFGKARQAILSLLYGRADEAFYLRQIVRATGIGLGPVQRELKQLMDAGIITREARGRQVYYRANAQCPIFNELNSIMIRTAAKQSQPFSIPKDRLAEFCCKHHIKRLALFGSVLREDFRPDSDIDVLVEFEPDHIPGFAIVDMENELSQLVGRKVDLRTPNDLSRYFREQVVREARVEYADSRP